MEIVRDERCIDVLLVEDNEGDVVLFRTALKANHARFRLHVVSDGVAALDFVRKQSPRPQLLVLDLNLPRKTGLEVLAELKSDPKFAGLPVVIFSSSAATQDVEMAYRAHASGYIQKPDNVDSYFSTIASFERYWIQMVLLPRT
jgi:two-component system, chemotaxis family, response regulator Rcp1